MQSSSGRYLEVVDDLQVDVLQWLPGTTLKEQLDTDPEARKDIINQLGKVAAQFHEACDRWNPPVKFDRPAWNAEGLVGQSPLWGRFWENPGLELTDRSLFESFQEYAFDEVQSRAADLDYGLIHADLLGENVLLEGDRFHFIDFDDGGWGFRIFELTTVLIRQIDAPDYEALKQALFEGYRSVRPLDTKLFDLFLALRATSYIGWIADRQDLHDANERLETSTQLARKLITPLMASD